MRPMHEIRPMEIPVQITLTTHTHTTKSFEKQTFES